MESTPFSSAAPRTPQGFRRARRPSCQARAPYRRPPSPARAASTTRPAPDDLGIDTFPSVIAPGVDGSASPRDPLHIAAAPPAFFLLRRQREVSHVPARLLRPPIGRHRARAEDLSCVARSRMIVSKSATPPTRYRMVVTPLKAPSSASALAQLTPMRRVARNSVMTSRSCFGSLAFFRLAGGWRTE